MRTRDNQGEKEVSGLIDADAVTTATAEVGGRTAIRRTPGSGGSSTGSAGARKGYERLSLGGVATKGG